MMPDTSLSIVLIALIPVFSAYRLARFNIDEFQQSNFLGLATPSSGFFFAFLTSGWWEQDLFSTLPWLIYALPVVFSILMVAPVKMFSLKGFSKKPNREKIITSILITLGLVLLLLYQLSSIPIIVLSYVGLAWLNSTLGGSEDV